MPGPLYVLMEKLPTMNDWLTTVDSASKAIEELGRLAQRHGMLHLAKILVLEDATNVQVSGWEFLVQYRTEAAEVLWPAIPAVARVLFEGVKGDGA